MIKKFIFYAARWQLSGIILAPVVAALNQHPITAVVIGNFLGACVFFWVDKLIFKGKA